MHEQDTTQELALAVSSPLDLLAHTGRATLHEGVSATDRKAVADTLKRIEDLEAAIKKADDHFTGHVYLVDAIRNEKRRDFMVGVCRKAIDEQWELLSQRLNIQAVLHERGLLG